MPALRARVLLLLSVAIALSSSGGCGASRADNAQAVQHVLEGGPVLPVKAAIWQDVRAFYAQHPDAPWLQGSKPSGQAGEALALVRKAREHGLDPADYGSQDLAGNLEKLRARNVWSKPDPAQLYEAGLFDVRMTTALLALARDVALGRTAPTDIDPEWKARREKPDLAASLARGADGDLNAWMDSVRPAHPEYAALQKILAAVPADAPIDDRFRQIAANLERWRWLPNDFGPRYLLVNIPSFHVLARENGQTVKDIRVIVGKNTDRTPVFSAVMTTVVFSPYWNIPETIAKNETVPAILKDRNYLAKNEIEIVRRSKDGVVVLDPGRVRWNNADELKELAFRQKPGAKNALGHVMFLFPNPFAVYLHDTPADELFAQPGRALSHGCIRVEEPFDLAKYVLRGDADWDDEKIKAAMNAGVEKHVNLKEQIPVHIVYFTAWPDGQGGLQTYKDIYGYDAAPQPSLAKLERK